MHNDNSLSTLPSNNTCSERIILQSASNNNDSIRKKRSLSLLAMEGLLLLGVLGIMLVIAWSHAPVVGLDAVFAPDSSSTITANTGRRLWRMAPLLLDTTTTRRQYSNNSAEASVLVGAELMAQSPSLEFALQSVLKPALVDAVLAVVLHSLVGVTPLWGIFRTGATASKWLAASGRMRHRLGALVKRWLQAHGGGKGGIVTALVRRTGSSTTKTRRLWDSSKRAVQHLYKKRARYSVASELTNLVPPEPKNGSKTTAVEE